jgi:hypothetical protein
MSIVVPNSIGPGKHMAFITVYENGNVVWHEVPGRSLTATCLLELRQMPSPSKDLYNYQVFPTTPMRPVWFTMKHKQQVDKLIDRHADGLTPADHARPAVEGGIIVQP